tara:strand:+ start:519 stop:881 length:363 start_codon:yes stop_codon:yes gene_type:complete
MVITKNSKEREYPLLMKDITNGHVIYFYKDNYGFDLMDPDPKIMDWRGYGGLVYFDNSITLINDSEVQYPKLKRSFSTGAIVLFTGKNEGFAFTGPKTYFKYWNFGNFTDYNKELTLKNK